MRLEGKVAVITGAGQTQGESIGNGRAAAVLFAREGAKLVLANRTMVSLEATRELLRKEGFDVHVVALPKGSKDPADDPSGFQARLAEAASYPLHGIRVICERPGSAQEKFVAAREFQ